MHIGLSPSVSNVKAASVGESAIAKGKQFSNVLQEARNEKVWSGLISSESFRDLRNLQNKILHSQLISPKDLILYQIKSSQFGLGIELVSKVAESVSASIR